MRQRVKHTAHHHPCSVTHLRAYQSSGHHHEPRFSLTTMPHKHSTHVYSLKLTISSMFSLSYKSIEKSTTGIDVVEEEEVIIPSVVSATGGCVWRVVCVAMWVGGRVWVAALLLRAGLTLDWLPPAAPTVPPGQAWCHHSPLCYLTPGFQRSSG